jgi:Hydrazine synthase alpha subunit middle domain/WD40-like Beta Propeller Repeat
MYRLSRQTMEVITRKSLRHVTLLAATLAIAACGGGDGVSIGSGQDPDPVVIDFPIAYVRAPIPVDDGGMFEQQDLREQITFDFGADLFFRDRASPSAEAINITGDMTQGLAAIRDVEIAYDGSTLLFAMRFPFDPNLDEDELPTWNIWEYTFETDQLRRVIASDLTAESGHDIMPKYLPDGRIIFSSTRQTRSQAVLLDEGKPGFPAMDEDQNEFAFNLHVMNPDGTNVEQVSYNQSHDLDPSVLSNGQVVFSRWDHAAANDSVNLYRMNPDGSALELLYGRQSHATGTNGEIIQFMQPRELEDGRVMSLIRPFTDTEAGGELVVIDTPEYLEITQPTSPNIGILSGPAQEDATVNEVSTEAGTPSPGGRYGSVYPILDGTGRLLVSWSQCRLLEQLPDDGDPNTLDARIVPCTADRLANLFVQPDPDNPVTPAVGTFVVAPPLYGIWMYDPRDDTQRPVVAGQEGFMFTEVVAADPKVAPPVVLDGSDMFPLDPTLADTAEAVINIRSVYDFDGAAIVDIAAMADPVQTPAANRPARFLRVEKAVSIPDDDLVDLDDTAFGVTTQQGMKEIVSYTMIEPDGSVMAKVPANVALAVSVVDENGKRITARHQNWIQLRPGQELRCNGCHVSNSGLSHGRYEAFDTAYAGAPVAGVEFPNTDPMWFVGEVGETMAEVRARITCASDGCSSLQPSMNVIYRDVWSADPVIKANNEDIDFLYSDLTTTSPTSLSCQANWQPQCRSVINYETIIHPLWSVDRLVFDDMGNPVLDGNGVQVNNKCTNCHTQIDPADGMTVIEPAGQLELTDGLSPDEPDHFHAYRELLVTDNLQVVMNGALVDAQQQVGVDIDGNPIFDVIPIPPPASVAGARASGRFFGRFEDPADMHFDMLSGAERRLIAEWLDVGAQYYNNPFDVPQ